MSVYQKCGLKVLRSLEKDLKHRKPTVVFSCNLLSQRLEPDNHLDESVTSWFYWPPSFPLLHLLLLTAILCVTIWCDALVSF